MMRTDDGMVLVDDLLQGANDERSPSDLVHTLAFLFLLLVLRNQFLMEFILHQQVILDSVESQHPESTLLVGEELGELRSGVCIALLAFTTDLHGSSLSSLLCR